MHLENATCYFNGEYLPYEQCNVHISDLGFQRGYGVFDFFRVRNGKAVHLDRYMKRLFNSIKDSGIQCNLSEESLKAIIRELRNINGYTNEGFKVIVSGGNALDCATYEGKATVVVLNFKFPDINHDNAVDKKASLVTYKYTRPEATIKSLNYYTSVKQQSRLKQFKAIDVLYYDSYITEASRSNIFFIKKNKLITPKQGILKGITRSIILDIAKDLFEVEITDIRIDDLHKFDEVFITSSGKDVTPIISIDGHEINNGIVGEKTQFIMKAHQTFIKQKGIHI